MKVELYGSSGPHRQGPRQRQGRPARTVRVTNPTASTSNAIPAYLAAIRESGTLPLAGQRTIVFDEKTDLIFNRRETAARARERHALHRVRCRPAPNLRIASTTPSAAASSSATRAEDGACEAHRARHDGPALPVSHAATELLGAVRTRRRFDRQHHAPQRSALAPRGGNRRRPHEDLDSRCRPASSAVARTRAFLPGG